MNILQQLEQESVAKHSEGKKIDDFAPGDTVRVNVRIVEGTAERVQAFEGICIGRKDRGLHSSFTIRKISHGEGVERVFPLYGPRIDSVERVRKGNVRRAKLYYLRGRTGKSARITEKLDFVQDAEAVAANATAKADARTAKRAAKAAAPKAEKKAKEPKAKKPKAEKAADKA